MEFRKMVLMNLVIWQEQRCRLEDTVGEGEARTKRVAWTYIHYQMQNR